MNNLPLPVLLLFALQGKSITRMIADVAELGIADQLQDQTLPVSQLAVDTETNEDALYRVLRALSALGVFKEETARCFSNNEASYYLQKSNPNGIHAFLCWENCKPFWNAYRDFEYSLKSGVSAFTQANGQPLFDYLKGDPETSAIFNHAMTRGSLITGPKVAQCYNFSPYRDIVDIGGGHGAFLKTLLKEHKHLQGIVFDQPEVISGGDTEDLGDRLVFEGGSFFERLPEKADIYTIKHIIHDWNDELSVKLLRACRDALSANGRILVVEQLVSNASDGLFAKLADIEMLAITHNGRERTKEEFDALFTQAGLKLKRAIPIGYGAVHILEGEAV